MKLFKSFLIKTTLASHFRGSTWLTSIDANGDLQIDNPQAWRKGSSHLPGMIVRRFSIHQKTRIIDFNILFRLLQWCGNFKSNRFWFRWNMDLYSFGWFDILRYRIDNLHTDFWWRHAWLLLWFWKNCHLTCTNKSIRTQLERYCLSFIHNWLWFNDFSK